MNCTVKDCPNEARADSNLCQHHILETVKPIQKHLRQTMRYGIEPIKRYKPGRKRQHS